MLSDEVRDRVQAILTLADAATPRPWSKDYYYVVGQVPKGRPGGEVIGQMTPSVGGIVPRAQQEANAAYVAAACNAFPEVAARLLEALDTIDRARELHRAFWSHQLGDRACCLCRVRWPCPTWQALNGGNE